MQRKCAFVLSLLVVALTLPCQAQPASEQEKNKTVARAFFEEVLGQGKLERYTDFHTADYVGHFSDNRGISRMTIVKTSTSYFACASPATTAATLSSIWFQPSS
jgi:hypothetical protein